MYKHLYTYVYTCAPTHVHICAPTHTHTCMHARMHTHTHTPAYCEEDIYKAADALAIPCAASTTNSSNPMNDEFHSHLIIQCMRS